MTARRIISRLLLPALTCLVGALSVSMFPFALSKPNVTIDVFDRRYACGDCYIRFGISKVHGSPDAAHEQQNERRPESPQRFAGWDVLVVYKGSDSYLSRYQDELFAKDNRCAWPTFRLTGQFKRRLIYEFLHDGDDYDGIYFDARSGVAITADPACETQPAATRLP